MQNTELKETVMGWRVRTATRMAFALHAEDLGLISI